MILKDGIKMVKYPYIIDLKQCDILSMFTLECKKEKMTISTSWSVRLVPPSKKQYAVWKDFFLLI